MGRSDGAPSVQRSRERTFGIPLMTPDDFQALKMRTHQNPPNLREVFEHSDDVHNAQRSPKRALGTPRENLNSPNGLPQRAKLLILHCKINDFESHAKSLLGDPRRPKSIPEALKIHP